MMMSNAGRWTVSCGRRHGGASILGDQDPCLSDFPRFFASPWAERFAYGVFLAGVASSTGTAVVRRTPERVEPIIHSGFTTPHSSKS